MRIFHYLDTIYFSISCCHNLTERNQDDQWLVEQAQKDLKAFEVLYEKYYDKVYTYFHNHIPDKKTSEDLTAMTFDKILNNLSSFQAQSDPFETWIFGVADQIMVDHVKEKNVMQTKKEASSSDDEGAMAGEKVDTKVRKELFQHLGKEYFKTDEEKGGGGSWFARHSLITGLLAILIIGGAWLVFGRGEECVDACQADARICNDDLSYSVCGNFDDDTCLEWSEPQYCSNEFECRGGKCVTRCENECEIGMQQCSGAGYQTCGNFDDDHCLEWGEELPCADGTDCQFGACLTTTPGPEDCLNECDEVKRRCAGDGYQICGAFDEDPCLEWGIVHSCETDFECSFGVCKRRDDFCEHECEVAYEKECFTEEDERGKHEGYKRCGNFDGDGCLEWGMLNPCLPGETCEKGACE